VSIRPTRFIGFL